MKWDVRRRQQVLSRAWRVNVRLIGQLNARSVTFAITALTHEIYRNKNHTRKLPVISGGELESDLCP
jgi:hypothetical protein